MAKLESFTRYNSFFYLMKSRNIKNLLKNVQHGLHFFLQLYFLCYLFIFLMKIL